MVNHPENHPIHLSRISSFSYSSDMDISFAIVLCTYWRKRTVLLQNLSRDKNRLTMVEISVLDGEFRFLEGEHTSARYSFRHLSDFKWWKKKKETCQSYHTNSLEWLLWLLATQRSNQNCSFPREEKDSFLFLLFSDTSNPWGRNNRDKLSNRCRYFRDQKLQILFFRKKKTQYVDVY